MTAPAALARPQPELARVLAEVLVRMALIQVLEREGKSSEQDR